MNNNSNPPIPIQWFLVVPFLGVIGFGVSFINFSIVPVKSVLETALHIHSFEYGLVLASYSFVPVFLFSTVAAGFLADRWSMLQVGGISVFLIFLSTTISLYASTLFFRNNGPGFLFLDSFLKQVSPEAKLIILSFLLLGAGGESFFVISNKILSEYFPREKLPFAMAFCYMITRLGMQTVFIIIPMIAQYYTTDIQKTCYTLFSINLLLAGTGILLFSAIFLCTRGQKIQSLVISNAQTNRILFQAFKELLINRQFMLLAAIYFISYSSIITFISFLADYLLNEYNYSIQKSSYMTSMIVMGFILFTPLLGWYLGKVKDLTIFLKTGSGVYALSFALLLVQYFNPLVALSVMSIGFALIVTSIWPLVSEIVEKNHTGIAFGLMYWLQNLGFFLFPLVTGILLNISNGRGALFPLHRLDYYYPELFFIFSAAGTFLLSIFLKKSPSFTVISK